MKVKKRSFLHGKKVISEFLMIFTRAGPVGWKVIWKLPGPIVKPSPPLVTIKFRPANRPIG